VADWVAIGSLDELRAAGRLVARVGGREVGVVWDPEREAAHGIRNRCPHGGGPLCHGRVRERESGTPGHYELAGERVLRCPWHGWEFDLASGQCLDDPSLRAAVYRVDVSDGVVRIEA
jgi:3-phenylpropionate/trans-cinnamate dioxygenase ferredoxin subunit